MRSSPRRRLLLIDSKNSWRFPAPYQTFGHRRPDIANRKPILDRMGRWTGDSQRLRGPIFLTPAHLRIRAR